MRKATTVRHDIEPVGPVPRTPERLQRDLWQPTRPEFTMFMIHRVTCPACRLARLAQGGKALTYLHVHRSADLLVITEANDLHHPGRSLCAAFVADTPTGSIFRLLDLAPAGVRADRFRSAVGMVDVSWTDGRRKLRVVGEATDMSAHHKVMFDAVEAGS